MVVNAGQDARRAAIEILGAVLRQRRPLDAALQSKLGPSALTPRDAGFARAIVMESLRRLGQLDDLIRRFAAKPPPPHKAGPALEILIAGACELVFLGVAPHAAVDAANRLAAADGKAKHFKPLINAVLRRIAAEGTKIVAGQDAARLNTPDWLWRRWCDAYGEAEAGEIAAAHLAPPPLDLAMRDGPVALDAAQSLPGRVLRLDAGAAVETLPGYSDGRWWVQDFAATLPARLFGDVKGQPVLDLCAAPGGKSAELIARGAALTALEREPARMARLRENLSRLKMQAECVEADLRDWRPQTPFPFVLLDAPCSATGTVRRHPELPWIKTAADITFCATMAGELLDAAAQMVAAAGTLVFAVCSLEPEEGPEQVAAFLRRNADFARRPIEPPELFGLAELITPDGDLRTLPSHFAAKGGMDGFYAARLVRSG